MRRFPLPALLAAACAFGAVSPAAPSAPLPNGLYAEFDTPHGPVICELLYRRAPLMVTNFVGLVEGTLAPRDGHPFYTGLKWYRVVPNFVIQSGNPGLADTGDTPIPHSFPDEFVPGLRHDRAGILSMANAGPDTNGCEFFLTLRDTNRLNYLHSVFGRTVRGADLLPVIQPDESFTIKILRLGAAAQSFRADRASFDALRARAKKYSSPADSPADALAKAAPGPTAHFDDPDHLIPTDPPRAKNFNFKLANFERATGVKLYARLFAKFTPASPGQRPGNFTGTLARQLGLAQDGILAAYFADLDQWGLWIGDAHVQRFMGRAGSVTDFTRDGSLHRAKQSFVDAARGEAAAVTAEMRKSASPGQPVTRADEIKYFTDAVLDDLIFKFEPQ
ncbi:MAG TPA: peptidylprolyl isomerase [Opitutus sp.]|nr:peptidylprolyl isomerase [Opitutus sp.]